MVLNFSPITARSADLPMDMTRYVVSVQVKADRCRTCRYGTVCHGEWLARTQP